jgi:peptidoglycan/LPS O-acetylase OafA/YrhL
MTQKRVILTIIAAILLCAVLLLIALYAYFGESQWLEDRMAGITEAAIAIFLLFEMLLFAPPAFRQLRQWLLPKISRWRRIPFGLLSLLSLVTAFGLVVWKIPTSLPWVVGAILAGLLIGAIALLYKAIGLKETVFTVIAAGVIASLITYYYVDRTTGQTGKEKAAESRSAKQQRPVQEKTQAPTPATKVPPPAPEPQTGKTPDKPPQPETNQVQKEPQPPANQTLFTEDILKASKERREALSKVALSSPGLEPGLGSVGMSSSPLAAIHNVYGIKFTPAVEALGATDSGIQAKDGGTFAAFASVRHAHSVAMSLLMSSDYQNRTLDDALQHWSNDGYGGSALSSTGLDPQERVSDLKTAQLEALLGAIQAKEGVGGSPPGPAIPGSATEIAERVPARPQRFGLGVQAVVETQPRPPETRPQRVGLGTIR